MSKKKDKKKDKDKKKKKKTESSSASSPSRTRRGAPAPGAPLACCGPRMAGRVDQPRLAATKSQLTRLSRNVLM